MDLELRVAEPERLAKVSPREGALGRCEGVDVGRDQAEHVEALRREFVDADEPERPEQARRELDVALLHLHVLDALAVHLCYHPSLMTS